MRKVSRQFEQRMSATRPSIATSPTRISVVKEEKPRFSAVKEETVSAAAVPILPQQSVAPIAPIRIENQEALREEINSMLHLLTPANR